MAAKKSILSKLGGVVSKGVQSLGNFLSAPITAKGIGNRTTHTGAWGTPELGVTEKIGDILGQGRTAQGGSGLKKGGQPVSQIPLKSGGFQQLQGPGYGIYGAADLGPGVGGNVGGASTTNDGGGQISGGGGSGGGGGGGGGNFNQPSPEEAADQLLTEAFNQVYQEYFGNTTPNDPFAFDEALARNAAIQKFSPFYAQTLQQFLQGVRLRASRSQEDAAKLADELQQGTEFYSGRTKRLLDLATEQAGQGFEERGLFDSGQRRRATGILQVERGNDLKNFLQGQQRQGESIQQSRQRALEDILLEKNQRERELASSQEAEVSSAVEEARRRDLARGAVSQLEAIGPAPGQNYTDFLNQRGKTLQQFLLAGGS